MQANNGHRWHQKLTGPRSEWLPGPSQVAQWAHNNLKTMLRREFWLDLCPQRGKHDSAWPFLAHAPASSALRGAHRCGLGGHRHHVRPTYGALGVAEDGPEGPNPKKPIRGIPAPSQVPCKSVGWSCRIDTGRGLTDVGGGSTGVSWGPDLCGPVLARNLRIGGQPLSEKKNARRSGTR